MIDFYIENGFSKAKVLLASLVIVFSLSWIFSTETTVLLCISYIIFKLNTPHKRLY
jgi:hypothetical protein